MQHIWTYWETPQGKRKPAYLDLCFQTVLKNCQAKHEIHLLNEKTVMDFIGNDLCMSIDELNRVCKIPQKVDYFRLLLLKKYGGVWLDADIIVFRDLLPFTEKITKDKYDYVGFGCYYEDCETRPDGAPRPANWCMISDKNGLLVTSALREVENILLTSPRILKTNYHAFGKDLLHKHIEKLSLNKSWAYYHVSSRCLERDSQGRKLTNERMISKEDMDVTCVSKLIMTCLYNTAPGFPHWFLVMSREDILHSDMLVSKFLRHALRS